MTKEQKMRTQFKVIYEEIAKRDRKKRKNVLQTNKMWPVVNFINILQAAFARLYSFAKKLQSQTDRREAGKKICTKKTAH